METKGDLHYIAVKDLNLASYLYSIKEISLVGIDRANPSEVSFRFSPKEKTQLLIRDYWLNKAKPIQPRKLFSSQRDLKDLIFKGD